MSRMTLHHPEEIFSARHAPSWLMLAFASGCVNAIAFVACERFVTHVTGTATQIGVQVAHLEILLDFVIVLGCFVIGAMASAILINGRVHRGKPALYTVPLIVVAAATAAVGIAGHAGWLGAFGGTVDEPLDFVLLSVLSFASGLQNAAVGTSTGLLVRTTHLTGPATDLGIHLVELAFTGGQERKTVRRHALLRGGKIVAFIVGGIVGVKLAHRVEYLALLAPAAVVVGAIVLSFTPARVRELLAARRHRHADEPVPSTSRPGEAR